MFMAGNYFVKSNGLVGEHDIFLIVKPTQLTFIGCIQVLEHHFQGKSYATYVVKVGIPAYDFLLSATKKIIPALTKFYSQPGEYNPTRRDIALKMYKKDWDMICGYEDIYDKIGLDIISDEGNLLSKV